MVRVAPIRLRNSPRILWFDARDFQLPIDQEVIVETVRGLEYGKVVQETFEPTQEQLDELNSELKPVVRFATPEDADRMEELEQLSLDALSVFRDLANATVPEMNPISVEYLFEGDKAVFYFEAEERVDFRELVRKLAAQFHVRVDMKQIGVRDKARMVGGYGHCGQELCCSRFGGNFDPVSIRMAKGQDLSLNPQKISGVCGRLMCCLRYEYETYKEFKSRAPKRNAKIETPEGIAKVVDLDVPREIVSVRIDGEKPVSVPLADMQTPKEGGRPNEIDEEAWERANTPETHLLVDSANLFTPTLGGQDQLMDLDKTHRKLARNENNNNKEAKNNKSNQKKRKANGRSAKQTTSGRKPRRRSTKVTADKTVTKSRNVEQNQSKASQVQPKQTRKNSAQGQDKKAVAGRKPRRRQSRSVVVNEGAKDSQRQNQHPAKPGQKQGQKQNQRPKSQNRSRRNNNQEPQTKENGSKKPQNRTNSRPSARKKPGQNSSALRANRNERPKATDKPSPRKNTANQQNAGRKKRRSHTSTSNE